VSDGPRREFATEVVARLRAAGFVALWAGGCVRDLELGLEPTDYDVATDATPPRVMALFRRTVPVGLSFGVVRVLGPSGAGEVEVATFRSDGTYLDGRRPESVKFGTPEEDAKRRDFTINGLFLDPADGRVIDYVGGLADLKAGVLRAIGDPAERFGEDKLRLLRAARFAARFGLAIDPSTLVALRAMAAEVTVVAAERIAQELRRMLAHPSRAAAIGLMAETGLMAAVLPEVGEASRERAAKTLKCLPDRAGFELAMAALLGAAEDARIGPEPSASRGRKRSVPTVVSTVAGRLKLANEERARIGWLVENRDALAGARSLRVSRLKRLLSAPAGPELIDLQRARALAAGLDPAAADWCAAYRRDEPDGPLDPPPLVTGHDLHARRLSAGPAFAAILEEARDAQLEGSIATTEEASAWLDRRLTADRGQTDQR